MAQPPYKPPSASGKPKKEPYQPKRCYLFPKTLSTALDWSVKDAFAQRGFSNRDVIRRWSDIVGEKLARVCTPVKMTFPTGTQANGQLYLKVTNGSHALEVQFQEPIILERLAMFYGYRIATRIVILQ
jgi:hypothetical protein